MATEAAAHMAMAGAASSVLLMMLLVAGTSAAAAIPGGGTIRLPSDDARGSVADLVTAMASSKQSHKKRPWECCNVPICTKSFPPTCRCTDIVDRCSDACKKCVEAENDSRQVCADWYQGDPGPSCHEHGNGRAGLADAGQAAAEAEAVAAEAVVMADGNKNAGGYDDKKRPWKCCDLAICTRSMPPICHCWDKVKKCASSCQRCEQVEGSGSGSGARRYRCFDEHHGDPGPRCHEEADYWYWARRLATAGHRFRF